MRLFQRLATALSLLATAAQSPVMSSPVTDAPDLIGQWEGESAAPNRWPLFLLLQIRFGPAGPSARLSVLGQTVELPLVRDMGGEWRGTVGEGREALTFEGAIVAGRLRGRLIEGKNVLPFELTRLPVLAPPADRVEAWQQDIAALETRFLRFDRSFNPKERQAFLRRTAALKRALPSLRDQHVQFRIAAAIALAHNAHTRLYLVRSRTAVRSVPVRLWWFADGIRIVRASPAYADTLGCRVDAIEGVPVRRARSIAARAFAGNAQWADYMSTYTLASPDVLFGADVARSPDAITYKLAECGRRSVRLPALPLQRTNEAVEAWWDLSPTETRREPWTQVLRSRAVEPPLYLRGANRNYWFVGDARTGTLYFQYSRAAEMPAESMAAFAERLLVAIRSGQYRTFVLDLRFNTGGNGALAASLMQSVRQQTQRMSWFVIVGPATFSAGIADAARWRSLQDVTFVGERVGDTMDFWAEGGNIILPNSGLAAHFANGAHSYSAAPCPTGVYCLDESAPSLAPDVRTPLRWRDYLRGVDPAMEAVERLAIRPRPPHQPAPSTRDGVRVGATTSRS